MANVTNVTAALAPASTGLASLLGFKPNPFLSFIGDNRSALAGLAAGLTGGSTWGQGLSNGFQLAAEGRQMDQQHAEKLKADALAAKQTNATRDWLAQRYPDLAQAVDAGLPVSEAWNEAFNRMNAKTAAPQNPYMNAGDGTFFNWQTGEFVTGPNGNDPYQERFTAGQNYGLEGDELNRFALTGDLPGANQSVRASVGQPVYMRSRKDPNVWGSFAPMSDGTLINQLTGEIANDQDWVADPAASTGAKTTATQDAKTAATARAALPSAELNFEIATKAADALLADQQGMEEQFGNVLGVPQQWTGALPGSAKANFRNQLDQLTGQAFLNIRQALKGAGAVTDYEGQRGEVALSRAQAAAERGDKRAFQQAVIEFKDAITKGLALLRQQAQGGYSAEGMAPPVPNGDDDIENILSGLGI